METRKAEICLLGRVIEGRTMNANNPPLLAVLMFDHTQVLRCHVYSSHLVRCTNIFINKLDTNITYIVFTDISPKKYLSQYDRNVFLALTKITIIKFPLMKGMSHPRWI